MMPRCLWQSPEVNSRVAFVSEFLDGNPQPAPAQILTEARFTRVECSAKTLP